MITLVMALRLVQTSAASAPAQTRKLIEQLDTELTDIAAQTEVLSDQFDQQQDVLNSGALVDAATLQSQQNDLDDRRKRARSDVAQLSEQHQQVSSRQQKLATEVHARSSEVREIDDLRKRLAEAESSLEEIRTSNRVLFNPAPGSNRTPWLVEFDGGNILAAEMGKSGTPQSFSTVTAFLAWAKRQSRAGVQFVLLVKPDSIENYHEAFIDLRQSGFTVGVDVLTQDQQAISTNSGAGTP